MKYAIATLLLFSVLSAHALEKNGFVLNSAAIPVEQILHGGPPKDGIPSIDAPEFLAARQSPLVKKISSSGALY